MKISNFSKDFAVERNYIISVALLQNSETSE